MKKLHLLAIFAALVTTSAQAQVSGTKYYIDWDNAAKKCIVVADRPTTGKVVGGGPYESRDSGRSCVQVCQGLLS